MGDCEGGNQRSAASASDGPRGTSGCRSKCPWGTADAVSRIRGRPPLVTTNGSENRLTRRWARGGTAPAVTDEVSSRVLCRGGRLCPPCTPTPPAESADSHAALRRGEGCAVSADDAAICILRRSLIPRIFPHFPYYTPFPSVCKPRKITVDKTGRIVYDVLNR